MGINSAPKPSPTMATLIFRLLMLQGSAVAGTDCKDSPEGGIKVSAVAESHSSCGQLSTANFRRGTTTRIRHCQGAAGILPAVLFSDLLAGCRQRIGVQGEPRRHFCRALGP